MFLPLCSFTAVVAVASNSFSQYITGEPAPALVDPGMGFLLSNTTYNHSLVSVSVLRGKRNCLGSSKTNPLLYLCCLIVAQSGDTHPIPGPRVPRFPCGSCKRAVHHCHEAILCDDCDTWYHKDCIGMSSAINDQISRQTNSFSWICCSFGMPNFSSALFDTDLSQFQTSNYFSHLDATNCSNLGSPIAASSPKAFRHNTPPKIAKRPLKSLIINCQSL